MDRQPLAALILGLLLSAVFSRWFAAWIAAGATGSDIRSAMAGMRWLVVIGIVGSAAAEWIFRALHQLISTASAGDPFVRENDRRLQTIGWGLLVLQLLDLPAGVLGRFYPAMGSAAPGGEFSVVGWIAVLMVFVLGRVFATGAAMRDDRQGTI